MLTQKKHSWYLKEHGFPPLYRLNLSSSCLFTQWYEIRVHFSYKGHPLVGDALYNGNTNLMNRQALHSYEVDFIHPIKNEKVYVHNF